MAPTSEVPQEVYCDYEKKEYYDSQGQFCKRCDKCLKGWGEVAFEDREFEIDSKHGALGCLHCVRCRHGTYSGSYSYGQCQPCRNCHQENRYTYIECSATRNAVCGGVKPVTTSSSPSNHTQGNETQVKVENIVIGVGIPLVGILVLIALIYFWRRKKKSFCFSSLNKSIVFIEERRTKQKKDKSRIKRTQSVETSSETEKMISSNSTVSSDGKASDSGIETDGFVSHTPSKNTIEQWKTSHDCSVELSPKHAQMISRKIATKDNFRRIGIHLTLKDNDIDVIESDYKGCETHAYQTLRKWKEVKGSGATVGKFLAALEALELFDIAEYFCNEYDKNDSTITRL